MSLSTFQLVGALIGAVSLFSMAEQIWQFGVSSVLGDILEYYRRLANWSLGWIGWPFDWRLTTFQREVLALQLLCSSTLLRSGAIRDLTYRGFDNNFRPAHVAVKALILLTPLSIMVCYSSITDVLTEPFMEEKSGTLSERARPFVFASLFALLALFALNAYGLSAASD
ncbi:hypothetical protein [Parerythrobacter aestuarii]|uniref:hypothetical protein n=1 Tax=Parerythrobacter aestuarii TaxID=3020909 RepID=UPI0024DEC943|nr:hypothetical protein [Parerythrobacter aestuarii]